MEEAKAQIAAKYDPMQILDILSIDNDELVDILEEQIRRNLSLFTEVSPEFILEEESRDE